MWYTGAVLRIGALLVLSFSLGLPGCGYRLAGAGAGLDNVESVAIRTPRNDSFLTGVEFVVADALRRELLRRGGAELTEDPDEADLVVSGRVTSVETNARSFSSVVFAIEYEVTLALDLQAERPQLGPVPVSARVLSESERYLSSADVEAERKNRDEAVRRVASVLATRYFDAVGEALASPEDQELP